MNRSQRALLDLCSASLWGKELCDTDFRDAAIDWEAVMEMSVAHTVSGLVGHAMSQIPKDIVPRRIYLSLLRDVAEIEDANKRLNALIPSLFQSIEKLGAKAWLLKGQGVAQNYIDPMKRQSGDIDVLIPDTRDYETVRTAFLRHLTAEQISNDNPSTKTLEFTHKGVYVELHGRVVAEVNRRCHKHFPAFLQRHAKGETPVWNGAPLPPPMFDAVFIFEHTVRHYFGGGIGLRQVCDWMRFMHVHHAEIDRATLEESLATLGLRKIWQAFSAMAVDELGCPADCLFLYDKKYSRTGARLLRNILRTGNFGYHDDRTKSHSRFYYVRRFRAFWGHLQMKADNLTIFPAESIYGIPSLVADGLKRTRFFSRKR